jgi:hypothetical protein
MSINKFRPSHKCIYVIPEIRGNIQSLEIILNRILPLRKFKNQEDIVVFLGNYIDGDEGSDKVIDCLINIKEEYKDRAIILRGSYEEIMLRARNSEHDFTYWTDGGGINTIAAYSKRAKLNTSPHTIKRNRLQDLIPIKHYEFLNSLDYYSIIDDYCFFNGGFNNKEAIAENNKSNFIFDYTSSKYVKECVRNKVDPEFKDNYIYIAHHNYNGDRPFIHPKYFMLEGLWPQKMIVMELNSMTMCAISKGKSRIYPYQFDIHE